MFRTQLAGSSVFWLRMASLLTSEDGINEITKLGIIASQLQEVHPLALAKIYDDTDGFKDLDASEIAALFSCFTNVSVSDELKLFNPMSRSKKLDECYTRACCAI